MQPNRIGLQHLYDRTARGILG